MRQTEGPPCVIFKFGTEGDCYVDRRCPKCRKFLPVTAFRAVLAGSENSFTVNVSATCPQCGAVKGDIVGWF